MSHHSFFWKECCRHPCLLPDGVLIVMTCLSLLPSLQNLNFFNTTKIFLAAPSVESSSEPALTRPSVETKPAASVPSERASSLVNLLSKVEMSPADILSALSKVQGKGSREGEGQESFV